MGKSKKPLKNKGLIEFRVRIDSELVALFDAEAAKDRRKRGPHLETLFEERYRKNDVNNDKPQPKETTDASPNH